MQTTSLFYLLGGLATKGPTRIVITLSGCTTAMAARETRSSGCGAAASTHPPVGDAAGRLLLLLLWARELKADGPFSQSSSSSRPSTLYLCQPKPASPPTAHGSLAVGSARPEPSNRATRTTQRELLIVCSRIPSPAMACARCFAARGRVGSEDDDTILIPGWRSRDDPHLRGWRCGAVTINHDNLHPL